MSNMSWELMSVKYELTSVKYELGASGFDYFRTFLYIRTLFGGLLHISIYSDAIRIIVAHFFIFCSYLNYYRIFIVMVDAILQMFAHV